MQDCCTTRWSSPEQSRLDEALCSLRASGRLGGVFRLRWRRAPRSIGWMARSNNQRGLLQGARVYLSGPMDFVASRAAEKKFGWRNRVGEFLEAMGVTVFDPWFKPSVRGLHEYGQEDVKSGERIKRRWTYEPSKK